MKKNLRTVHGLPVVEQMPQQVALSQDASMAVCAVIDQRWDVHVVENFDAGPR
ncbi:MAG: hypothetical protein BMS9Abin29_2602 [Gemmatimonadota bacterium]|nr:MAG: hypothetical protein BMS9Abin29_2602 [Gemmatimonadota bacterium]